MRKKSSHKKSLTPSRRVRAPGSTSGRSSEASSSGQVRTAQQLAQVGVEVKQRGLRVR